MREHGLRLSAFYTSNVEFYLVRDDVFARFVSNLRDQMTKSGKIRINQDEIKKLTGSASSRDEGE